MSVPRQNLAAGRAWLCRAGGVLGFPIQMGSPTSRFCKNCHWKWTRTISKALDPSHGLAEDAAAVLAGVSLDQEGEVEAWLLEQSPGFLPLV